MFKDRGQWGKSKSHVQFSVFFVCGGWLVIYIHTHIYNCIWIYARYILYLYRLYTCMYIYIGLYIYS